jgi:hypothetical protein
MHLKLRSIFSPELALILLLGAGRLFAQSTGSVRGTVSDSSGAAIPDASVTVTNTQTAQTRSTQTTGSGVFVFPELPIGSYELQVSKTGFNSQKRGGTQLLTGQTIGLDIILAVGSQIESVSVQGDTQQIQTTTSTVSQSIDADPWCKVDEYRNREWTAGQPGIDR